MDIERMDTAPESLRPFAPSLAGKLSPAGQQALENLMRRGQEAAVAPSASSSRASEAGLRPDGDVTEVPSRPPVPVGALWRPGIRTKAQEHVRRAGQELTRRFGDTAERLLRRRGTETRAADAPMESEKNGTDRIEALSEEIARHRRTVVDIKEKQAAVVPATQQRIAALRGKQQRAERSLARASKSDAAPEVQAQILQESTSITMQIEELEATVNDFATQRKERAGEIAMLRGKRDQVVAGLPLLDRRQAEALVRQAKGKIKKAGEELGAIMRERKQTIARADALRPGWGYESESKAYEETLRRLRQQGEEAKLALLIAEELEAVAMRRAERATTGGLDLSLPRESTPRETTPAEAGPSMTEEEARELFDELPRAIRYTNRFVVDFFKEAPMTRNDAYLMLARYSYILEDTDEAARREFNRYYQQARHLAPDAERQMNETLVREGLADLWLDWRKQEEGLALWHDPATLPGATPPAPVDSDSAPAGQTAPEAAAAVTAIPLSRERVDVPTIAHRPREADGTLEQHRARYPEFHLIFDLLDEGFGPDFNELDSSAVWAYLRHLDPSLTRNAVYAQLLYDLQRMTPDEFNDARPFVIVRGFSTDVL